MTSPHHASKPDGSPREAGSSPREAGGPVHFLHDLRCIWCHTLNTTWLWADHSTVECAECGQTSLTTPQMIPHGPLDMTGEGA